VVFAIEDLGADTLVTMGSDSILFAGVSGDGRNVITADDFLLA
jgi:hypothetical protein